MERKPPISIEPTSPPTDTLQAAAFVFVHGLGDEAEGVESACLTCLAQNSTNPT
jgi:lysophospholipase-1